MVGGAEEAFKSALPLLEVMGKNIVHCGAVGTGQVSLTPVIPHHLIDPSHPSPPHRS
jgi:hypothetical protein